MKSLAVYNIKGGVGKTATAVNLAHLASNAGIRTLLWDIDPQGAASFYFRVKPKIHGGLARLLDKKSSAAEQIKASDFPGLDILPADFSYRHLDLEFGDGKKPQSRLKRVFKDIREDYDLLIIDCPPSISLLSETIFHTVDALLVPTIPTTLSLRTLQQLLKFLRKESLDDLPVLAFFSMADLRKNMHKEVIAVRDRLRPWIMDTVIPYCSDIERMGIRRQPVTAYAASSRAALAYESLWEEVRSGLVL